VIEIPTSGRAKAASLTQTRDTRHEVAASREASPSGRTMQYRTWEYKPKAPKMKTLRNIVGEGGSYWAA
jgi:hypothetical protein